MGNGIHLLQMIYHAVNYITYIYHGSKPYGVNLFRMFETMGRCRLTEVPVRSEDSMI